MPGNPSRRLIFRTFPGGRRLHLTVGEAADHLQALGYQASTSLIRKLEREGLIAAPGRSAGNYRLIDEGTLTRLRRILGLRVLGLSIEETRAVLDLLDRAKAGAERDRVLSELETRIGRRVKQLTDLRAALREHHQR